MEQGADPVDEAQKPACEDSVQDDGACNGEDLAADTEYLTFFFELNGWGGNGIGESGNGYEGSCAAPFGKGWVDVESGQDDAEQDQEHTAPASRRVLVQSEGIDGCVQNELTDDADDPPDDKGFSHAHEEIIDRSHLFYIFVIFLLLYLFIFFSHYVLLL